MNRATLTSTTADKVKILEREEARKLRTYQLPLVFPSCIQSKRNENFKREI